MTSRDAHKQDAILVLQKETLVSQVCEHLRGRIVNLSLKPGERIDVKQLAQELSVSPTPVREALHKLVEQGLVVAKPYVGYFVVKLTAEDIQELFDLRKAIEILALKYIIEDHNGDVLEDLQRHTNELAEEESFEMLTQEIRKFDDLFHVEFLIKGSHNKWLTKLGNGVIDLIRLTTQLSLNPRAACAEHREILSATAEGSLEKATSVLEAHLERAKQDSIAALQEKGFV